MTDYEIERIYNEAIEGEGKTAFDGLRAVAEATRAQMIADGWRNCAQGQRTTQFCRLLHQAVEAERDQLLPLLRLCASYVFAAEGVENLKKGWCRPVDALADHLRAVLPEIKHD